MAYFDQEVSLSKMVQHIYGNTSYWLHGSWNMFVKELKMYIDYLKNEFECLKRLLRQKKMGKTIWPKESGITSPCLHRPMYPSAPDQLHSYKEERSRFWIGIKNGF
jgi:hypothetical protein